MCIRDRAHYNVNHRTSWDEVNRLAGDPTGKICPFTVVDTGAFASATASAIILPSGDGGARPGRAARSAIPEYYTGLRIIVHGTSASFLTYVQGKNNGQYAGGSGGAVYYITSYDSSTREITLERGSWTSPSISFSAGHDYTITLTQRQMETRIGRGRAWITGDYSTRKPQANRPGNAYGGYGTVGGGDTREGESDYACFLGRIRNGDAGASTGHGTYGERATSLSGYITAHPFYGEPGTTHYAKLEMACGGHSGSSTDFKYYLSLIHI